MVILRSWLVRGAAKNVTKLALIQLREEEVARAKLSLLESTKRTRGKQRI
ncbi:hypothetical protein VCR29J2_80013 [Vibrio coralliirubri]|nr:hypothetical protein VCR29J2_80013 [Vibrio coralliirubri]